MPEWEKDLPPIIREKLAKIGKATAEEKEQMRGSEQLDSLLSEFYKGELNSEGLWEGLKEWREQGKGFLLREAQMKLIDSLSLGSAAGEFQRRREGILAIETLKEEQNIPMLELHLNSTENLQRRYKGEMEQAYNNLKMQVERNPQLRMQQVKQGQTTVVMQLTVDEAVKISPEWKSFAAEHERRYGQEFAKTIEKLKKEAK
jgi:hypothetical protein